MKCKKCGENVKAGDIYCAKCGHEIQIVVDYNVFEDDISNALVSSQNEQIAGIEKTKAVLQSSEEPAVAKKRDKKKIALIITAIVIVIVAIILGVSILITNRQKNSSFSYQYERAESYYNNQLPDKALESINKALNIESNNENALLLKGKILISLNRTDDAINTFLSVIEVNANSVEGYQLLINMYAEKGDYQAIADLSKKVTVPSLLAQFSYYVPTLPKFKQAPGNYEDSLKLEIQADSNSQIFYTLDGTSPITNGQAYTREIELEPGEYVIRVVSTNEYGIYTDIVEGKFVIEQTIPDKPVVSLASGTYETKELITITVPAGCVAYYTWDGSIPNASSYKYTGPFEIIEGNNILSVIIMNANNKCSEVARFNYIYYNLENDED